ncbi:MAG: DUF547 domain-containing protein [Hyphomicrobiaceae bacterium]
MKVFCATQPVAFRCFAHFGLAALLLALVNRGAAFAAPVGEIFARHSAGSTLTVDHSTWNRLLEVYVVAGADGINRVDYKAWKAKDHGALKGYVKALEATDPARLDRAEQFAFWANLYNAKTIDVILDHYPVKSIREITINEGLFGFIKKSAGVGGPWKTPVLTVSGQKLSLDNIEHEILRPLFKDPRVHYSVNCASVGCPNLPSEAFTGAKLEAMLDAGARAYVNHPRGIAVSNGKVVASSIYDWFQSDFGGTVNGVLSHVRKFAAPDLAKRLDGISAIASYDYDWSLNDAKR